MNILNKHLIWMEQLYACMEFLLNWPHRRTCVIIIGKVPLIINWLKCMKTISNLKAGVAQNIEMLALAIC